MALAITVNAPNPLNNPASSILLLATDQLANATTFLEWEAVAAAAGIPAQLSLANHKAIKAFLQRPGSKKIKLVWIDAQSMPQDLPKGSRSVVDSASFKLMLAQVNMLFLGTTVLILLDLSYVSRFWVRVATRITSRPHC